MARISRAASATALMLSTLVQPMPAFMVRSPLTRAPFSNLSRAVLQAGKGFGDTPKPKPPQEPAKENAPRKVCWCALQLVTFETGLSKVRDLPPACIETCLHTRTRKRSTAVERSTAVVQHVADVLFARVVGVQASAHLMHTESPCHIICCCDIAKACAVIAAVSDL